MLFHHPHYVYNASNNSKRQKPYWNFFVVSYKQSSKSCCYLNARLTKHFHCHWYLLRIRYRLYRFFPHWWSKSFGYINFFPTYRNSFLLLYRQNKANVNFRLYPNRSMCLVHLCAYCTLGRNLDKRCKCRQLRSLWCRFSVHWGDFSLRMEFPMSRERCVSKHIHDDRCIHVKNELWRKVSSSDLRGVALPRSKMSCWGNSPVEI